MSEQQRRTLVVKCTFGTADPERCAQAFTVAATAVAAGAEVSLWLTGEAAWLALPGRAEHGGVVPDAAGTDAQVDAPPADLVERHHVLREQGRMTDVGARHQRADAQRRRRRGDRRQQRNGTQPRFVPQ